MHSGGSPRSCSLPRHLNSQSRAVSQISRQVTEQTKPTAVTPTPAVVETVFKPQSTSNQVKQPSEVKRVDLGKSEWCSKLEGTLSIPTLPPKRIEHRYQAVMSGSVAGKELNCSSSKVQRSSTIKDFNRRRTRQKSLSSVSSFFVRAGKARCQDFEAEGSSRTRRNTKIQKYISNQLPEDYGGEQLDNQLFRVCQSKNMGTASTERRIPPSSQFEQRIQTTNGLVCRNDTSDHAGKSDEQVRATAIAFPDRLNFALSRDLSSIWLSIGVVVKTTKGYSSSGTP